MYSRYIILRVEITTEAVCSLCIIISIYITLVGGCIQNTAHGRLFVNFPNVAATTQPPATVLTGPRCDHSGPHCMSTFTFKHLVTKQPTGYLHTVSITSNVTD